MSYLARESPDPKNDYVHSHDPLPKEEHAHHQEYVDESIFDDEAGNVHGFETDESHLPPGYFRSPRFIGSFLAIGVYALASFGGFGLIAPVLNEIKADVGPETGSAINWLALVYTLGLSVGLTIAGRLSDLFGRRYFFLGGTVVGITGCIVCATAHTVPVLIGGQTLIGISTAMAFTYPAALCEIVPMRYRFLTGGTLYIFGLGGSGFAAAISNAFILHTKAGWRWCYYLLLIENGLAAVLFLVFYFPPNFAQLHSDGQRKMEYLKNFDFIGLFLYTAGLTLFIIGLNWGGTTYPWKSANVIATIVIGLVCLVALFVYEAKVTLKEPLIPMRIILRKDWLFSSLVLAIGASIYYSMAIVWPTMCTAVYADGRQMWAGWTACAASLGTTCGAIVGGWSSKFIGRVKYQCIFAITLGGIILACMATTTPDTVGRAIAFITLASFAIGWAEVQTQILVTMCVTDQHDIGVAAGLAGSIRSAVSTVASAIYVAVLTTRLTTTIPAVVVPALVEAGLPPTSIEAYFGAAATGTAAAFEGVKGITPAIIAAGTVAYKVAYSDAFQTVFLSSIAFSGIGIILAFFVPNVEELMTRKIGASLHTRKMESVVDSATVEK